MNLPLLAVSTACQRLNFTDFGSVGTCFVDNVMFGDVALVGIIILIMVIAIMIKNSFPMTMMIPVGISLGYVLMLMTGLALFEGIMLLGLIIGGAMVVIAILQFLNR